MQLAQVFDSLLSTTLWHHSSGNTLSVQNVTASYKWLSCLWRNSTSCPMSRAQCSVTLCYCLGQQHDICEHNFMSVSCHVAYRLFGGARLEMITSKDSRITFADIAGIDQVKAEIVELVQFLKNPKRFLDLGARSPAGVLLVGPPGTGRKPFFPYTGPTYTDHVAFVGLCTTFHLISASCESDSIGLLSLSSFSAMGYRAHTHDTGVAHPGFSFHASLAEYILDF